MSVSFKILTEKKQFLWLTTRKLMRHFKINYCRKGNGVSTLIDDEDNYIIKVFKHSIYFIISDNEETCTDKFIDGFIDYINLNYKNTTIGFIQETGRKVSLDKFKGMKITELNI